MKFLASGKFAETRLQEQTVESRMEGLRLSRAAEFSPEKREEIRELVRAVTGDFGFFNTPRFALQTGPTLSMDEAITQLQKALDNKEERRFFGGGNFKEIDTAEKLLTDLRDLNRQQQQTMQELNSKTRSAPAPTGRQEK